MSCIGAAVSIVSVFCGLQGFQEQDSHELLRVLLEGIQAEESRNFTEPQPRPHPTEEVQVHLSPQPHSLLAFAGTASPAPCCC